MHGKSLSESSWTANSYPCSNTASSELTLQSSPFTNTKRKGGDLAVVRFKSTGFARKQVQLKLSDRDPTPGPLSSGKDGGRGHWSQEEPAQPTGVCCSAHSTQRWVEGSFRSLTGWWEEGIELPSTAPASFCIPPHQASCGYFPNGHVTAYSSPTASWTPPDKGHNIPPRSPAPLVKTPKSTTTNQPDIRGTVLLEVTLVSSTSEAYFMLSPLSLSQPYPRHFAGGKNQQYKDNSVQFKDKSKTYGGKTLLPRKTIYCSCAFH